MHDTNWVYEATINNEKTVPLTINLEPWGDRYEIGPGEHVDVISSGQTGAIVLDVADEGVTVNGWEGSVLELSRYGKLLTPALGARPPFPPVPKGYSP